jgi:hypothetical protein
VLLQRDGTVVFNDARGRLAWASVAHPAAHVIPPPPRGLGWVVGLAHDRIAFTRGQDRPYLGVQIVVMDIHGRVVAHRTIHRFVGTPTFDGRRVAFATQSCQTTAVAVWDLRDPVPPVESRKACPAADAASHSAVVTSAGRMRVRLHCAPDHKLGCAGRLHLLVDARGVYAPVGTRIYNIAFGRTRTVSMRIPADAARFLASHPDARAFGATRSVGRTSLGELQPPTRGRSFLLRVARPSG